MQKKKRYGRKNRRYQMIRITRKKTPVSAKDENYKAGMEHLVKGEFVLARPFLEKAADAGHAEAAYNLASIYVKGEGGEQNYQTAVSYLEKSSNGGYYPAMTNLGLLYAEGRGVKQNYLTARSWWLKAAAGEHADAMHNLAVIYATGKGVKRIWARPSNGIAKGRMLVMWTVLPILACSMPMGMV